MIEDYLTAVFKPDNHPAKAFSRKQQEIYLYGIGEILHLLDPNNSHAKFLFECLCDNILEEKLDGSWSHTLEMVNARKAQNLFWNGFFRFIRITDSFWWDLYHIAYMAQISSQKADARDRFIKITNKKSEMLRKAAFDYFYNNGDGAGLNSTLLNLSSKEKAFISKPLKRFLIVGTMSAGKSTLINALIGRKVARVKTTVCTTHLSRFLNRDFDDGILYSDCHTSSLADEPVKEPIASKFISLQFNSALSGKRIMLIDTPGVDYAYDESHREITQEAIKCNDYEAVICVVNTPYIESDGEMSMIESVLGSTEKKKIFILNQLDRFDPEDDSIEESVERFKSYLKSKNVSAEVVPFSAKLAYGLKTKGTEKNSELDWLLKHFQDRFYDLGYYGCGYKSNENDLYARSGLTNLESIIANQ